MANYVYQLLTPDEQDDIIAGFLLAQERDLYSHTINKQRFESMLATLPDGTWKKRVQELKDQTDSRLNEVQTIIEATKAQLPSQLRLDAAKARMVK